jgi:hypothetical protein
MIGFVEMAHDRRTYRFLQDTRHGRVMIAETERIDRVVAAITNYIARRLVERERALASDWRSREGGPTPAQTRARAAGLSKAAEPSQPLPDKTIGEAKEQKAAPQAPAARRSWASRAGDLFSFLLLVLGSMTFCLLIGVAAYAAWDMWGRAAWTAWIGPTAF